MPTNPKSSSKESQKLVVIGGKDGARRLAGKGGARYGFLGQRFPVPDGGLNAIR